MTKKTETSVGGGSGGGPDLDHYRSYTGTYAIAANQVEFLSRPPFPPVPPAPYLISIVSTGMGMDGFVDVRGTQGVRITAGPEPGPMLPTHSDSTKGVEVVVGTAQKITLKRGLIPKVDQQIEMKPGSISIDGGTGKVTIESMTNIELKVAGGVASIKLTPVGIILQGPLIQIN
jgi:hypothetical protein